jgi:hypothetical protein
MTLLQEAGMVRRIDDASARQRRGKHSSAAWNKQARIEIFLEAMFSVRPNILQRVK